MTWLEFEFNTWDDIRYLQKYGEMMVYYTVPELRKYEMKEIVEKIKNRDGIEIKKIVKIYGETKKIDDVNFHIWTHELTPKSREIIRDLSKLVLDVKRKVVRCLSFPLEEEVEDERKASSQFFYEEKKPSILNNYFKYLLPLEKRKIRIGGMLHIGRKMERMRPNPFSLDYSFYDLVFTYMDAVAENIRYEEKRKRFIRFCELGKKLLFYYVSFPSEYLEKSQWGEIFSRIKKYNKKIFDELDHLFLPEVVVETVNSKH